MKSLQLYRSASWAVALVALLLLSGNANATLINIGGFADNGSLSIEFEGTELGGDPAKLEFPVPDDITAFSASYSDDSLVGTISWGLTDLGSLVYNTSTGILETLSALDFIGGFELNVGSAVLNSSNYVEIYDFNFTLVAASQEFPRAGNVPAPGTLLLLSLGLLLLRRRRA